MFYFSKSKDMLNDTFKSQQRITNTAGSYRMQIHFDYQNKSPIPNVQESPPKTIMTERRIIDMLSQTEWELVLTYGPTKNSHVKGADRALKREDLTI